MNSGSTSATGKSAPSDAPQPRFDAFSHTSTSALLEAFVAYKKNTSRYFSISGWSQKLKLPSSGIIVNLLKKRRLPPEALIAKLATSMGLSAEAKEYFSTLVAAERAKLSNPRAQTILRRRLKSLRLKAKTLTLEGSRFEPLSQLHLITIKEMLGLKGFSSDPSWIQERLNLPVSRPAIEAALQTLVKSGVVKPDPQGNLQTDRSHIQSPEEYASKTIRAFHHQSLKNAPRALEETPLSLRHFDSYVMPIDSSKMPEAKLALADFLHDFASRFEAPPGEGDQVYQLNLHYLPLTRSPS